MSALKRKTVTETLTDELKFVEVSNIVPNRNQPRKDFNQKELEELAESIDVNGMIQPIAVRLLEEPAEDGEEYELIAGERRWRAHILLDKKRIKAIISVHTENESSLLALIENLQRTDLSPIEEAYALRSLMEKGKFTQETLAKQIGKSRPHVANALRLIKLESAIQTMITKKELEYWHGLNILSLPKEEQLAMAQKAVDKKWSVAELKKHVDKATGKNDVKDHNEVLQEEKEIEEQEKIQGPKHPIPDDYILIKIDSKSEEELETIVSAFIDTAGFHCFFNEDIKTEIKRATSPLQKLNEERKAAKLLKEQEKEQVTE
jgi:ParB family chromosome partitioning protein